MSDPSCCKCGAHMSPGVVFFADMADNAYCDSCWHSTKCSKCSNPIPPSVRVVKEYGGRNYHTDCWRCTSCKKSLKNDPRDDTSGWYRCAGCDERCAGCCKPLGVGKRMELGDSTYHTDCFKCTKCAAALGTEVFLLADKVVCKACVSDG